MSNDLVESYRAGGDRIAHLRGDRIARKCSAMARLTREGELRVGSILDDRRAGGDQAFAAATAGPRRHESVSVSVRDQQNLSLTTIPLNAAGRA